VQPAIGKGGLAHQVLEGGAKRDGGAVQDGLGQDCIAAAGKELGQGLVEGGAERERVYGSACTAELPEGLEVYR
jgi:hypothetical protein